MPVNSISLALNVVWALALVVLLLFAMAYIARALQRGRVVMTSGRRLVSTIESTGLAQNVAVHVVKVGERYYLVGGGTAGVSLLAELPREEVEPYLNAQRQTFDNQRDALVRLFGRFKRS
jgi:flagellar biogenesis protein FliO